MVRAVLTILWLLICAAPLHAKDGSLTLTIQAAPGTQRAVVGEMIEVTIRAQYDRKVANETMEIAPTDAFDWIQTKPDNWREERIDGKLWIVMERHLALWPKRSGMLQFGPAHHRLTIITRDSQRSDMVIKAEPLALAVDPFPAGSGTRPEWHMAARALELTEELSADAARLEDGQALTRRVTLRALGLLPEHLPPRPIVSENWLITFTPPVERELLLTEAGPVAQLVWTWQMRPHTGEPGVLDPIPIRWFDTDQRKLQVAEIPPLAIGLASYYTGQTPTGRLEKRQMIALAVAAGLGVLAGLALAARHLSPGGNWRQPLLRMSPLLWLRYLRARQRGDLLAARSLGQRLGLDAAKLAALDKAIYGRPSR